VGRVNCMSLLLHHKEFKKVLLRKSGGVVGFFLSVSNSLLGLDIG
jgi:hypothetical protein